MSLMAGSAEYGLCECGCGQKTNIATHNDKSKGWVKGEPLRFILGHQTRGRCSGRWRGGKTISQKGYVMVRVVDDTGTHYVGEHVLVAESVLGHPLPQGACVHHVDGDKGNNAKTNLVICDNFGYHRIIHRRENALMACGDASKRKCWVCKQYDDPKNDMYISPRGHVYHRECYKMVRRKRQEVNK